MGEANQIAGAGQDLADERVVYALVFSCVEHHVEQLEALMQEKVTAQDCTHFADEIAALDPEHRAIFEKDDEACVFFAVLQLQKAVSELIARENEASVEDAEMSGRRVHDFCSDWAKLFTPSIASV